MTRARHPGPTARLSEADHYLDRDDDQVEHEHACEHAAHGGRARRV